MNKNDQKSIKCSNCIEFLNGHPALIRSINDFIFTNLTFYIDPVCKRGYSKNSKNSIQLYKGEKNWKTFENKFKKEFSEEELKKYDNLSPIYVTYKERFNDNWKFDHIEYRYDLSFYVFTGNLKRKQDVYDFSKWEGYQGFWGKSKDFETMMISTSERVKKTFGNFSSYSNYKNHFYTEHELKNHKEKDPFLYKPLDNDMTEMIFNKKYFNVNQALINLRWLKWFVTTDYCKKRWKNEFNWVHKKELYPYG